jgi:ATP-binding cassette subfamily C protein
LTLAGMVVLVGLTLLTEHLSSRVARDAAAADARRSMLVDSSVRNAEPIRAMGFTSQATARFTKVNQSFLKLQKKAADIVGLLSGLSRVLRLVLQSAVLGLGAYLAVKGYITSGSIIAATIATSRAFAPVDQVIAHWRSFTSARLAFERLSTTFRHPVPASPSVSLPAPRKNIVVDAITVAAPGSQRIVVSNASFAVEAGQALALVGPSGSGKSSLVRALTGLWPCVRGSIRLDGAKLDRWSPEALGRHVGYLPQDVSLLEGTVADNISRLAPDATSGEIVAAAQAAGVHDMILELPEGYDTPVGPDGTALSAGQRQRVALAQALFRDPFLIVLDEPNSNLDADGEIALTAAVSAVRARGGIVVIVAHRPSAMAVVDLVAMVGKGSICAFGPRDEVLKQVLRQPLRAVPPVA